MVWDRRFELLTSRTPCVRATGLRQSQILGGGWEIFISAPPSRISIDVTSDITVDSWRRVGDSNSRSRLLRTNSLAMSPLQPLG